MSLSTLSWRLEDFNIGAEPVNDQASVEANEDAPAPADEVPEADNWTDGYIQAARHIAISDHGAGTKSELAMALHKLEADLRESADASMTAIAHLLLTAATTVYRERWSDGLQDRVQRIAGIIKPAVLAAQPELSLQSGNGEILLTTRNLDEMPAPHLNLGSCESISFAWKLGSAEYSIHSALRDMAWALAPLIVDEIESDTNLKQ